MSDDTRFPNIYRAALEIALDNGGINRMRPVEQQRREFDQWIAREPDDVLCPIEAWLAGLDADEVRSVCSDPEDVGQELFATAPPFTDDLLTRYFEDVC